MKKPSGKIKKPSGKLSAKDFEDQPDESPKYEWIDPKIKTTKSWPHFDLWERVRETLYALPSSFRMEGNLPEIPASDLHAANTLLGAAIEDHIPLALNRLRLTWDPNSNYADCIFKRQPQTFPDVPFRRETAAGSQTIFGIEIKSWYVLAKEQEPSFRFYVNRNFCHPADLCVVYPWALSAGVSGTPRLFRPLVLGARKAARLRNQSWVAKASTKEWADIKEPMGPFVFHPVKEDRINDSSPRDGGNNMGRIARTGVWEIEIERLLREETISGIPLAAWHAFLSSFRESTTFEQAMRSVNAISKRYKDTQGDERAEYLKIVADGLEAIGNLLTNK
jgi:hypothetical protein